MFRTVLVMIHAVAGVAGLVVGLPTLTPPAVVGRRQRWLRRVYAGCIIVLLVSMVVLIAIDWSDLQAGARLAFSGLTGLGAVMAYRLRRAHHTARARSDGWQERYIGHIYFTYISLWIGFLIVPALSLPLPHLSVPIVVLVTLAVGHTLIARYTQHVLSPNRRLAGDAAGASRQDVRPRTARPSRRHN